VLLTIFVIALTIGGGLFLWIHQLQKQAELEKDPAYQEQQLREKAEADEKTRRWREKMLRNSEEARKREAYAAARQAESDHRPQTDEERAAAFEAARENPQYRMDIDTANLYKSGAHDLVLAADMDIRNDNDFPVNDVTVHCALYDRARVETDSYSTVIKLPIEAHSSRWIPNVRTALFAENSFHASCTVAGATAR